MRKIITTTFVTLDGVMQAPGGPDEDKSSGFAYGGWSANYWDKIMGELMGGFMNTPFELLLGKIPTTFSPLFGRLQNKIKR